MTLQGTLEASTHGESYASLLAHHMDVQLASTYSFQTNTLVRLADILSADEALREFGNFYFMASNLLFAGGATSRGSH